MKQVVPIFLFAFFVSGFLFGIRMLVQFHRERILLPTALAKIGFALVLLMVGVVIATPLQWAVGLVFLLQTTFALLPPLVARVREQHFKKIALSFVDEIVLAMKSGRAFRPAFEESKTRYDAFTQQKLAEILSLVAFSQQAERPAMSKFAEFLINEFTQIDQKPHRAIQRLEVLRARLKMERDFRRRSGEAVKQARLQAVILFILYLGVIVAIRQHIQLTHFLPLLTLSALLMVAGYVMMWWLIRRFRWKV